MWLWSEIDEMFIQNSGSDTVC